MEDRTEGKINPAALIALSSQAMLPAKLYLIDRSQDLVREWKEHFANCSDVEVLAGDYFQKSADAMVSPANSFGIMDGGLDLAIRNELGLKVEQRIRGGSLKSIMANCRLVALR